MSIPGQLLYQAYQSFWSGFDWLYPPQCGGCAKAGKRWCDDCMSSVQLIIPPVCPICGKKQSSEKVCEGCTVSSHVYTAIRSWGEYRGPLRHAIQRLKYNRDVAMGEILARPLVSFLKGLNWMVDIVAPVPASLARLRERGYNQVSLLARPLGLGMELTYRPHALHKVRDTRSQVGLSAKERQENVRGVFQADRHVVNGKVILVIDDVTTTGSTLEECAIALKEAGAQQVYGLTLARSMVADHNFQLI